MKTPNRFRTVSDKQKYQQGCKMQIVGI